MAESDPVETLINEIARADNLRLHMGEMTAQEVRSAQAAVRLTIHTLKTKGILVEHVTAQAE